MICQRCGTKYDDKLTACPVCSQASTSANQPSSNNSQPQYSYQPPPQYSYTSPSPQDNQHEQAAEPTYYNYGKEFAGTRYNKRKRRKKVTSLVISISAAVIILAVFLLNFNAIVGFCLKTFASPDTYFAYVEQRASKPVVKELIGRYDEISGNLTSDSATQGKISVNLGKEVKSELGGDNFDWLDEYYITTSTVNDGSVTKTDISLSSFDTMLLGIETYVDNESGKTILGLPGLTNKYLSVTTDNQSLTNSELADILPDKKQAGEILTRYSKIVKNHSSGTRRATEDFIIDGVEQKLIMLELNFGRADMIELLYDIVTTLKEDEQILEIFDGITQKLVEKQLIDEGDDVTAEFLNELDGILKQLDEARTNVEIEIPTFRYRNFVNMRHDVVGKEITLNNKNVLYFLNVQNGKEIGSEIRIGTVANLIGYGTKKDGVINIDYTITNDGAALGTLNVADLYINKNAGEVAGRIRFLPKPRLIYDLKLPTDLAKMGAGLDVMFDINRDDIGLVVNLLSDGDLYFGVDTYFSETDKEKIELPTQAVFNGENESEQFFKTLNFNELEKKLQQAGFPQKVIQFTEYLSLIQQYAS